MRTGFVNFERNPESLRVTDLDATVGEFLSKSSDPTHRNASFDYCYNYFRTVNNPTEDIEKSCLALGFYLASWGMLRGSSFLLGKSAKYFERVVAYIETLDRNIWSIDVDRYTPENIEVVLSIYQDVRSRLVPNNQDLVLTTKVLLGVFGFIPAYDNYFTATFRGLSRGECGFTKVNIKSLSLIRAFYEINKREIDSLAARAHTFDFVTGTFTELNYPKAKIIDMYGFTAGLGVDADAETGE